MKLKAFVYRSCILLAAAMAAAGCTKEAQLDLKAAASASPWTRYAGWPDKRWDEFNTLDADHSPPIGTPPKVESPIEGDPKKGMELAFDRSRGGGCMACHVMGPQTPEQPGNVGPDLSMVGTYRSDEFLFDYMYDPRTQNTRSVMPPWGTHGSFTVDEIKDIVAFMKTLTQPATFKNPLDDPAQRPVPKETRDNLDEFENPAMDAVEQAKKLYKETGPNGKSCASCHEDPAKAFSTWAASMPKYEPRLKKALGVEEFVTRHTLATTGSSWLMQSGENLAVSVYLRYLANGTPIQVNLESAGAKEAAERGKALMQKKIGQLNFACVDCHQVGANRWIRGQWLGEYRGQTPHFPTWRTSRHEIWDLRKRMQWCNVAIRANELPPEARQYSDIELYLVSLSNGLPLDVPGIRH